MKHIEKEFVINEIKSGSTITSIAESLGVSRVLIQNRMKKWNISKKSIQFNENFFEKIDNEEKSYWLGFIMADGCISLTHHPKVVIKISNQDSNHLIKWHQAINSCLKIHKMTSGSQSQHYSDKMCQDLIKLGCGPRKSLNLKFPHIDEHLIRHFIRGYFDGDGCVDLRKHQRKEQLRLSFVGTKNFLSALQNIFKTQNKLQPTGNNKVARKLEICGNKKAKRIADWMYKDATVFLERKREVCLADL